MRGQVFSNNLEKTKWHQKNLNRIVISSDSSFQNGRKLAQKLGYKLRDTLGKNKIISLQSITPGGEPLYLTTHSTTLAGKMTKTNALYNGGSLGVSISGKSDTLKGKLGMWDGGSILENHVELVGRTTKQASQTSTLSSHSTHVAGILIAAGKNASVIGMSPEADLKFWDYDNDATEIAAAAKDLLVSNHSYGYQAGWVYDENRSKWTWWGLDRVSKTEDYKFGNYDDNSRQLDQIAYNAPQYLIVKSAGNSRSENGPAVSANNSNYLEKYYIKNTSTLDSLPRSKNDGYDIISTNANAKNILTVGALESTLTIPQRASGFNISSYTAWGPTDDGRIKPDLMGIGSNIYSSTNSTTGTQNNLYEYNSGTSMASPQVAGSLLLLQQLYSRTNKGQFMRSASLKGLALHTALDLDVAGPDYKTGWGVLNMEEAGSVLLNKNNNYSLSELKLSQSETKKISVTASGNGPLVVSISWTDPEGKTQGEILNDRTPRLVNDLDLRIKDGTITFSPYILDPYFPDKLAATGDNILDNFEKIIIPNAVPGKTYEISITHKGTLTYATQDFTLIISGINGTNYCSPNSPKTGILKLVKINNATSLAAEMGKTSQVNLDIANLSSGFVNAFIDWNKDGDFDDANEWVKNAGSFTASTYNFDLSVPNSLSTNNIYRLRIFVANQNVTNACSEISDGEVKDFGLQILESSYDLGLEKISQSGGAFCAGTGNLLYTIIRNNGSKTFGKFDVIFNIFEEGALKKSITKNVDSLQTNQVKDLGFTIDVPLINGKNYTYEAKIIAANDQISNNNQLSQNQLLSPNGSPSVTGLSCSLSSLVALSSNINSFWYNSKNALLGTGTTLSVDKGDTYFATIGGISQNLGPKTKYEFGTGTYYSNFGPEPIFDIKTPMVLESARIYTGTAGTIDFYVTDMSTGELVSNSSINLPATRIQKNIVAPPTQISDDKTDQGIVVNLNLQFPKVGKYKITQVCQGGASIFRSNRIKTDTVNAPTNIGFPYNSPDNLISLTGALYQGGVITSGYYYFYDMQFKSLGCASEKVSVPVKDIVSPVITLSQTGTKTICPNSTETINLTASANQSIAYQWQKNQVDIAGQTSSKYSPTTSGIYRVKATNADGCANTSSTFELKVLTTSVPTLYYNSNGILESNASGNISWTFNGNAIPGLSTNTYMPTSSGTYIVKGLDANGCIGSSLGLTITILGNQESNRFKIFPNPSIGNQLYVQWPDLPKGTNFTIEVLDILGQQKLTKDINNLNANSILDISNLSSGVYFIRILNELKSETIKFIKN